MMSAGDRVAVVGLGAMGFPIARRLMEAGFFVVGVDVAEDARRRFEAIGGDVAPDTRAMPRNVSAVMIVVVTADQVRAVLFGDAGLADRLPPETLVIISATISPHDARDIAVRLAAHGLSPIEAPVSGGVKRAQRGDLSVIVAGDPDDIARAQAFLRPISREVFDAGREFGGACSIKLLNQMLCGVHLAVAAEVVHFGELLGLDQGLLYRVITQSSGNSYMFADRVPQMLRPPADINSAVDIFLKDLRLAAAAGVEAGAPTLLASAAEAVFAAASGAGLGSENDSQIIRYLRDQTINGRLRKDGVGSDIAAVRNG